MKESVAGTQGQVQVTVPDEILVRRLSEDSTRLVPGPLRCPQCGQTTGLTLTVHGEDAHIRCPGGHSWNDPCIHPPGVRQAAHPAPADGPLLYPTGAVGVPLLAYLDEDRSLVTGRPPGSTDSDSDMWWDISAGVASSAPVLYHECLRQAHALACLAVTDDTGLYERLYPGVVSRTPDPRKAVDAHMAMVILALALYETARAARLHKITSLLLAEPAHLLVGDRLRTVRPVQQADGSLPLRATDDRRLSEAPAADWTRWRTAAADILTRTIRRFQEEGGAFGNRDPWRKHLGDVASRHFGGTSIITYA